MYVFYIILFFFSNIINIIYPNIDRDKTLEKEKENKRKVHKVGKQENTKKIKSNDI